jgi:hypothetical protein
MDEDNELIIKIETILRANEGTLSRRDLLRKLGITGEELAKALGAMVESKTVRMETVRHLKGFPSKMITLADKMPDKMEKPATKAPKRYFDINREPLPTRKQIEDELDDNPVKRP